VRTVISQGPPESQIGLVQLNSADIIGLYNIERRRPSPAAFGFFYDSIVVTLLAVVRPSDNAGSWESRPRWYFRISPCASRLCWRAERCARFSKRSRLQDLPSDQTPVHHFP
jgi:hypothetical protein